MLSSMASEARPVRMPASSFRTVSTDTFIFCLASTMRVLADISALLLDHGADLLAPDDAPQRALLAEVVDHDGQLVVLAQRDRGGVHDLEVVLEDVQVRQAVVLRRSRVLEGVGVVDPVHLRALEEDL